MSVSIEFFSGKEEDEHDYTYAIILAKFRGKWIFVRHKDRLSWELPAGHVEKGESVNEAAIRELTEETGAVSFDLFPLTSYKGWREGKPVYGKLFTADIQELGPLPDFEIAEVKFFSSIPENLTYPDIQRRFIEFYEYAVIPPSKAGGIYLKR